MAEPKVRLDIIILYIMDNYNRRCKNHDYRSKRYYMITMTTPPFTTPLSKVQISHGSPYTRLTDIGRIVKEEIHNIRNLHSNLSIHRHVIMPDHIHFLLYVSDIIPRHMGEYMGMFKGKCTSRWDALRNDGESTPLFIDGFHDRIVWREGQKEVIIHYIEDNPRRYMVKKSNPDLFTKYLNVVVNGREYAAFGNIFLLKDIDKIPVIIHRAWSEEQFATHREFCLSHADNKATLVSPFIHPIEKDIMKDGLNLGCNIIQLQNEGMPERFCPRGSRFDLCAEGRLLILAPWPDNARNAKGGRSIFLSMNEFAREICADYPEAILRKSSI